MKNHDIEKEIAAADQYINTNDYDAVSQCYTDDAALVVRPGLVAHGRHEIRVAHQRISEYFNGSLNVSQGDTVIIEAGDIALVLAKTFIESPKKPDSEYPKERQAIYVYSKEADGKWRCAVDNSYGMELLKEQ